MKAVVYGYIAGRNVCHNSVTGVQTNKEVVTIDLEGKYQLLQPKIGHQARRASI